MVKKTKSVFHSDYAQTRSIGRKIGRSLMPGDVVALEGALGSGKTTLVKGIAAGLGAAPEREVTSPSFALIHEYSGRKKMFHMDWYRLETLTPADARLAEECFEQGAVSIVEWPDRGKNILPAGTIWITLEHAGRTKRIITFT